MSGLVASGMVANGAFASGANALGGAALSAAICLVTTPALARLTVTAPDRDDPSWYRPRVPADRRRLTATAAAALLTGVLAGAAAGLSALLPALVAIALAGAPLIVIDYEHHRLPNRLVYPAALAGLALLALAAAVRHDWGDYLRAIEGGAAVYAVLFALMFISPSSFGWGDVRLGAILGLYLGYSSWPAVFYGILAGFVLGSLVAIALIATRRADRKTPIAFGPMLLLGALVVLAFALVPGS